MNLSKRFQDRLEVSCTWNRIKHEVFLQSAWVGESGQAEVHQGRVHW